jgi:hypothetical protein
MSSAPIIVIDPPEGNRRLHAFHAAMRTYSISVNVQVVERDLDEMRRATDRFLNLPYKEAMVYLRKTLQSFSSHTALSLGLPSGMIGVFAYLKARAELNELDLEPVGLIASGDIVDFVARLSIPFVLLLAFCIALQAMWVFALREDQRTGLMYAWKVILCLAAAGLLGIVFMSWTDTREILDPITIGISSMILIAAYPVTKLLRVGQEPGVAEDDRWQDRILSVLRAMSDPLGLLVVFVLLGSLLLSTQRISVLFASGASSESASVRVLESKSFDRPVEIGPRFTKLSGGWLVERRSEQPTSAQGAPHWLVLAVADVACVRPLAQGEQGGALTHQCTNAKPAPPPLPNTIAHYATQLLGCKHESFGSSAPVLVMRFETSESTGGVPYWRKASALRTPGLVGLYPYGAQETGQEMPQYDELVRLLWGDPASRLVILGFASTSAAPPFNLALSEARAEHLKSEIRKGVRGPNGPLSDQRYTTEGLGEQTYASLFGLENNRADQLAVAFVCRLDTE